LVSLASLLKTLRFLSALPVSKCLICTHNSGPELSQPWSLSPVCMCMSGDASYGGSCAPSDRRPLRCRGGGLWWTVRRLHAFRELACERVSS